MIAKLENYIFNRFIERFIKFAVIKILYVKVKFGISINPNLSLINSFTDNAKQIAAQLYKPIRHKFFRRKVIVYNLDEIWDCDLINLPKDPHIQQSNKIQLYAYNYRLFLIFVGV